MRSHSKVLVIWFSFQQVAITSIGAEVRLGRVRTVKRLGLRPGRIHCTH